MFCLKLVIIIGLLTAQTLVAQSRPAVAFCTGRTGDVWSRSNVISSKINANKITFKIDIHLRTSS